MSTSLRIRLFLLLAPVALGGCVVAPPAGVYYEDSGYYDRGTPARGSVYSGYYDPPVVVVRPAPVYVTPPPVIYRSPGYRHRPGYRDHDRGRPWRGDDRSRFDGSPPARPAPPAPVARPRPAPPVFEQAPSGARQFTDESDRRRGLTGNF